MQEGCTEVDSGQQQATLVELTISEARMVMTDMIGGRRISHMICSQCCAPCQWKLGLGLGLELELELELKMELEIKMARWVRGG